MDLPARGQPSPRARARGSLPLLFACAAAGFAAHSWSSRAFAGPALGRPSGLLQGEGTAAAFAGSGALSVPERPAGAVARGAYGYITSSVAEAPEDLMSIKQRPHIVSAEDREYAVVGMNFNKQHFIVEGGMYEIRMIRAIPGAKIRINRVFLLKRRDESGEFKITVGKPVIDGAYVEATVLEHLKSEDIEVFKHRPKKHRLKRHIKNERLTRLRVDKIVWDSPDAPVEGLHTFPARTAFAGRDAAWDDKLEQP